ncbi:nitroreductase [Actinomycetes bacterium KLBMP 9797]
MTSSFIEPLVEAAQWALRAPSVANTQPWRWRLTRGVLELYADRDRQLAVSDPDGRLLTISCGAALHHARLALAAAGHQATVDRFPDPGRPDLLARIHLTGPHEPSVQEIALCGAVPLRRTDRRAFGESPVPDAAVDHLREVVEAEGAFLHVVHPSQMPMLAVATMHAGDEELADPAYRQELHRWTHRPAWTGDGVPPATAVRPAPRRVPMRDYTGGAEAGLDAGPGDDHGASYTILFGRDDRPDAWLRAGEALSALLLAAVLDRLSAAPLSDVVEATWPRQLLRDLLAGVGEPYLVVRIGIGPDADDLPPSPRREPQDVIEIAD